MVDLADLIKITEKTVEVELSNGIIAQIKQHISGDLMQKIMEKGGVTDAGFMKGYLECMREIIVSWNVEKDGKIVKPTNELCKQLLSMIDVTKVIGITNTGEQPEEKKNSGNDGGSEKKPSIKET